MELQQLGGRQRGEVHGTSSCRDTRQRARIRLIRVGESTSLSKKAFHSGLGSRLREARRSASLTQGRLAELAGCSLPALRRSERGSGTTETFVRLTAALHLMLDGRSLPPGADLGERLRTLRSRRGIGRRELAHLSAVSVPTIAAIEKTVGRCHWAALERVAGALGAGLTLVPGRIPLGLLGQFRDVERPPWMVDAAGRPGRVVSPGRRQIRLGPLLSKFRPQDGAGKGQDALLGCRRRPLLALAWRCVRQSALRPVSSQMDRQGAGRSRGGTGRPRDLPSPGAHGHQVVARGCRGACGCRLAPRQAGLRRHRGAVSTVRVGLGGVGRVTGAARRIAGRVSFGVVDSRICDVRQLQSTRQGGTSVGCDGMAHALWLRSSTSFPCSRLARLRFVPGFGYGGRCQEQVYVGPVVPRPVETTREHRAGGIDGRTQGDTGSGGSISSGLWPGK